MQKGRIKYFKAKNSVNHILIVFATLLLTSNCKQTSNESSQISESIETESQFIDSLAIPDFSIYTIQDSSAFNSSSISKEGIIVIKYFSPDCSNCQEEAEAYYSKKDSLQNIRTVWITGDWSQLDMIREFAVEYKINQLNAIAVGKETTNDLVAHYGLSGVPFAAVYVDNQLVSQYTGSMDFDELIKLNYANLNP